MQTPPDPHVRNRPSSSRHSLALVLALFASILALAAPLAKPAHASSTASNDPIINWDPSMIYQGQNNNLPWGPVGEEVTVHGSNFTPGQQLTLLLLPGDSLSDPTICSRTGVRVTSTVPDNAGHFDAGFLWPSAAGIVGQKYSICAVLTADDSVVSTRDGGPFTVLASSPPTISLSTTSVAAGTSITITGQSWVPPQPVTIAIGNKGICTPSNPPTTAPAIVRGTVSSRGLNTGTFSITLSIPANIRPGTYTIDAYAPSACQVLLATNFTHQITVTAPTPTPTPSPTPSPTATATPTPAVTSNSTGNNTNTGQGGGNMLFYVLLAAIVLVVVSLGGLLIYMLQQRSKKSSSPPQVSPSLSGFFNQYAASDNPEHGFSRQPMNSFGQFSSTPNQFIHQSWSQPGSGQLNNQSWPASYPGQLNNQAGSQSYPDQFNYQSWPQNGLSSNANLDLFSQTTSGNRGYRGSTKRGCFQCGAQLPLDSQFCGNCGTQNGGSSGSDHHTHVY